jgi:hypothetical protein
VPTAGSTVSTSSPASATAASTAVTSDPATGSAATRSRDTPTRTSAFPTSLLGSWIGGDRNGSGSLTFTADGRFSTGKYEGTATVSGQTMTMRVDGASPTVLPWSLDGGVLTLGNSSYLRDDRRAGTISLVGYWINLNGWGSLRFSEDGSFELDDQANNKTTTGTYDLDGTRLIMSSRGKVVGAYRIRLDDTLTFSSGDGTVLGEYTRAG